MAALNGDDLPRLARLGALRRLEELQREEASIRSAFPELFRGRAGKAVPAAREAAQPAARKTTRRGRKKMSAAERKAVSERMRHYWAERRKSKSKD